MGPFKDIDSFSYLHQQANSRSMATFLTSNNGQIQGHQHLITFAPVGQFMGISSFPHGQQWAYS
jgi:hypothetical protein